MSISVETNTAAIYLRRSTENGASPSASRSALYDTAVAPSAGFSDYPAGRDVSSDLMSDLIHFLSKLVQAVRDVIRKKKR